jgi:endonuclease YncB( thermonuclease family)
MQSNIQCGPVRVPQDLPVTLTYDGRRWRRTLHDALRTWLRTWLAGCLGFFLGLVLVNAHLAATPIAHAGEPGLHAFPPVGPQRIVILKVLDGDTVRFGIVTPFDGRIYGINAPEKNTPEGIRARFALQKMLPATPLHEATLRGKEKYGRELLDVKTLDGDDVAGELVREKLAVPWDGRGPRP